jgi:hypothetical protein
MSETDPITDPIADPIGEGYRAMGAAIRDTPARVLVNHLLAERGLSWNTLHLVSGIPIRHLRLWRGGEAPDAEAFARLVEFADLLDRLDTEVGYTEPTQASAFIDVRITNTPGYHRKPLDLYLEGHRDLLITLAMGGDDIDREHALDRATPGWRDQRSDFETVIASDGYASLVRWRNRN